MSTHYWSEERMKGLLTKISNQIIKRCRAKINTHDMLEGDVDKCMRDLDESIECCNEWKRICTESQKTIIKYSNNPDRKWKLDSDETIFAENEAFIQRCKDCKDICEGQLQFARKGEGITLPKFGGSKGPEIKKNLDELQGMFQRYLEDIKDLDYDILDVKKTKWHDDYGQKFKENQKSLEIIYRNTVLHAFKNITTVTEGAEMLENFHQLAKRQLVKEYINTKAAEHVYKLFIDEMKEVEEMYENSTKNYYLPMPPSHPKFAGLAIWALSLIIRIDRAKKDIDTLFFIPHLPMRDEAIEKYRKLKDALDSFITKTQFEDNWTREITEKLDIANIDDKLKTPLLIRTDEAKGTLPDAVRNNPIFTKSKDGECLESNFDKTLLKTLSEGTYWTKLHALGMVTVNHAVTKLLSQKENLRKMRENVMLIVREYNRIIESITPEQKKVFKQHLENLDQIISYGMSRFKWNNNSNSFLLNSRANCIELFRMVKKFQKNEKIINKECEIISRTTLTKIGKELYGLDKFLKDQEAQLKKNEEKFKASFDKIGKFIIDTYQIFFYQHDEIQLNFLNYVAKLDKKIFSSLKGSIKNTILDLSKHIKGENKKSDEVQAFVPLFKVYNLINPNEKNITIIHDPSAEELKDAINGFILKIILVSKAIPNLEKVFRELRDGFLNQKKEEIWQEGHHGSDYKKSSGYNKNSGSSYPSFFDEFKDPNLTDEEKLEKWEKRWTLPAPYHEKDSSYKRLEKDNSLKSKTSGILDAIEEAKTLFSDQSQYWTKNDFKTIYNFSKNKKRASAFKNTIESDPLDSFKVLIDTVGTNIDQISGEPPQKPELFIQFDNTKMIESFQEIGYDHINEIYKMIVDEARGELDSLYNTFEHVSRELNTDTEDLKALKDKQELYEKIMNEREELKGRIEPIQRKFDYLKGKNQDHQLTEQEHLKLKNVYEAWDNFEKALHDGKQMVSKIQKKLKQGVDDDMEDFKKAVEDNKKQFQDNAPYSCDKIDNSEARDKIRESKKTTAELREREEEMKFGLDIFNIDHPVYPELSFVEKE